MPIAFTCSSCRKSFVVGDEFGGKPGKCANCGAVMQIPAAVKPAAATGPAALPVAVPVEPANGPSAAPTAKSGRHRARHALASLKDFKLKDIKIKNIKKIKLDKKGGLTLGAIAGIGAVFLVVLIGAIWLFTRSSSPLRDEIDYLPDNCQAVAFLRVRHLVNTAAYQQLATDIPNFERDSAVTLDTSSALLVSWLATAVRGGDAIDQVVIGADLTAPDEWIVILRSNQALLAKDITTDRQGRLYRENSNRVGGFVVMEGRDDSFAVVDSRTVVAGPTPALRRVLARGKPAELSENLSAALRQADPSRGFALAVDLKQVQAGRKLDTTPDWFGLLRVAAVADDLDWLTLQANFDSRVSLLLTVTCKDERAASDLRDLLASLRVLFKRREDMPRESSEAIETVQFYTRSTQVHGTVTFEPEALVPAYQKFFRRSVPPQPAPAAVGNSG